MPFIVVRNDITRMEVDAVVNSTNSWLVPGGYGVDASIHKAAGPDLMRELAEIGSCPVGEARITKAYNMPGRYIIHTAAPIWTVGTDGETETLRKCYISALELALQYNCSTVAFPVLSAGAYGCPEKQAFEIASETIRDWLDGRDITVYLVVFGDSMVKVSGGLYSKLREFIDNTYIEAHLNSLRESRRESAGRFSLNTRPRPKEYSEPENGFFEQLPEEDDFDAESLYEAAGAPCPPTSLQDITDGEGIWEEDKPKKKKPSVFGSGIFKKEKAAKSEVPLPAAKYSGFANKLPELDEGFGEALIRLQDDRGLKSNELCRRANITKAVLSNIKQSIPGGHKEGYKPTKNTAIAVGIALKLSYDELNAFIGKAGYTLSRSFLSDVIVEYCVNQRIYDIYEINNALYDYDQALLGSN